MTEAERDARDLNLHRVIETAITTIAMQFGKTRAEMLDHIWAFIELEREEEAERTYRAAIARELEREADA